MQFKLLLNRAFSNYFNSNWHIAITDCVEGLKITPNYYKLLILQAQCLSKLNDVNAACRKFEEAFKLNKTDKHQFVYFSIKIEFALKIDHVKIPSIVAEYDKYDKKLTK